MAGYLTNGGEALADKLLESPKWSSMTRNPCDRSRPYVKKGFPYSDCVRSQPSNKEWRSPNRPAHEEPVICGKPPFIGQAWTSADRSPLLLDALRFRNFFGNCSKPYPRSIGGSFWQAVHESNP
jgi:hypothetical protein